MTGKWTARQIRNIAASSLDSEFKAQVRQATDRLRHDQKRWGTPDWKKASIEVTLVLHPAKAYEYAIGLEGDLEQTERLMEYEEAARKRRS